MNKDTPDNGEGDLAEIFDGDEDAENFDVFGGLILIAEQNKWLYDHCPDEASLTIALATKGGGTRQVQVLYDDKKALVSFVTVHEMQVAPRDPLRLYECLNIESVIAQQTLGGGFTYVADLGVIVLRVGQSLVGISGLTDDWAYQMLNDCVFVMQQAQPKFMAQELPDGGTVSVDMQHLMNARMAGSA